MAKRKRKDKSKKARRQGDKKVRTQKIEERTAVVDVRPNLRKTAILTAVCLVILVILFLTQSRWSGTFSGF